MNCRQKSAIFNELPYIYVRYNGFTVAYCDMLLIYETDIGITISCLINEDGKKRQSMVTNILSLSFYPDRRSLI